MAKVQLESIPKRVTLRDIAKRLELSHATVSRALNHAEDPFISGATRERVREMARSMGYRPNHAARALVTGRTGFIALWIWSEDLQNSYHSSVVRQMHADLRTHPCQLVVDLVSRQTLALAAERRLDPWNVDGVIAHEAGPAVKAQLHGRLSPPVPVVSTGAYHFVEGVDRVEIDMTEGAEAAFRHLLGGGRKRIAYATDDLSHRQSDVRFSTYCRMMAEAGLPTEFIEVHRPRHSVRAEVRNYVATNGVPEAIFGHDDDIAIAAYRALCDLGIKVPDDVALVGCDGIEDTEYLEIPMTTIVQPFHDMCAKACELLEQRIQDPSGPIQQISLKPHLAIRASSET